MDWPNFSLPVSSAYNVQNIVEVNTGVAVSDTVITEKAFPFYTLEKAFETYHSENFDLDFIEDTDLYQDVWHPLGQFHPDRLMGGTLWDAQVKVYRVIDAETRQLKGVVLADFWARVNKSPGQFCFVQNPQTSRKVPLICMFTDFSNLGISYPEFVQIMYKMKALL
jgi:hypothetical protein